MSRSLSFVPAVLALAVAAACSGSAPAAAGRPAAPPAPKSVPMASTYAPELRVDLGAMTKTSTGLMYRDLTPGDGDLVKNLNTVTLHYTGYLPNGNTFDKNQEPDQPLEFKLGQRRTITGWEEGLIGMRVGSRRQLIVPPSLGYGAAGNGKVPPDATLVFVIDLLRVSTKAPSP
jgi:FKBP-type peptidyl-prolyl cis-trans isomerase